MDMLITPFRARAGPGCGKAGGSARPALNRGQKTLANVGLTKAQLSQRSSGARFGKQRLRLSNRPL